MRAAVVAVALVFSSAACGDDSGGAGAASSREMPAAPTYEATADELARMLGTLLDALGADHGDESAALTSGLELPAPSLWFETTFGSDLGARLFAEYRPVMGNLAQLQPVLVSLREAGQTEIRVEVFNAPGDAEATGYQNLALAAMSKRTPLYSARFTTTGKSTGFHLWSFVYHQGSFRWVGKLKEVYSGEPADPDLLELRTRLARQVGRAAR